jgi:DNA-directed RNA polymerase specialized sigma24 family protein
MYVDLDDLVSIGWEWTLKHPEKMDEFLNSDQPRLAAWQLDRAIWKDMERFARKERAQQIGYSPKDEASYSIAMIESLLQRVMQGDPVPDRVEQEEIRAPRDAAEGGDYLVAYLDVQRAWKNAKLSTQERTILEYVVNVGCSQDEAASLTGTTRQLVARAHERALKKLQKYLGGPPVGDCPYNCECHEGRLRQRPTRQQFMS